MGTERKLLAVVSVAMLAALAGCTSEPSHPAPENPSGALLDPAVATGFARDYVYRLYDGSTVIVPLNVTRKIWGGPAPFNGSEVGNCSTWYMYLEGVMLNIGKLTYVYIAIQITLKEGQVRLKHANVEVKVISQDVLNDTAAAIQGRSLDRYLTNSSSHELYLKAQQARFDVASKYYLQYISITLYHNTTSPVSNTAAWLVNWRYIDNDKGTEKPVKVYVNAVDGKVIKTEQ